MGTFTSDMNRSGNDTALEAVASTPHSIGAWLCLKGWMRLRQRPVASMDC